MSIIGAAFISLAQQAGESKFAITGNVKGLEDNSTVFLTDANNPTDTLAAAQVKMGQFVLNGHVPEPNLYEINSAALKRRRRYSWKMTRSLWRERWMI